MMSTFWKSPFLSSDWLFSIKYLDQSIIFADLNYLIDVVVTMIDIMDGI